MTDVYELSKAWLDAWCEVHGPDGPSAFEPSFTRQATMVMAKFPDLADATKDVPLADWSLIVSHVRNAHALMLRSSVRRTEEDRPA